MKNKLNVALFNADTLVNYNKRYEMSDQYTNIAFISYKREDEKWAKWLQKKLEHYQLPTEIRKQNPDMEFAERPRHVFKDTTDMSGGVLEKAIQDGLSSSKFLIVICSPLAAKSPWVCKEVQYFIDSGREEYIIPFIIDGEPHSKDIEKECFPEALRSLAGEKELLGININENGRESAAVKVIAQMFNVRFDTLWNRFQREKNKKTIILTVSILFAVLASMFVCYSLYNGYKHAMLEEIAKKEEISRANVLRGKIALSHGEVYKAFEYALSANVDQPYTHEAYNFLLELEDSINNWGDGYKHVFSDTIGDLPLVIPDPDNDAFLIVQDKNVSYLNARNGCTADKFSLPFDPQRGKFLDVRNQLCLWANRNIAMIDLKSKKLSTLNIKEGKILEFSNYGGFVIKENGELTNIDSYGNTLHTVKLEPEFYNSISDFVVERNKHQIAFIIRDNRNKQHLYVYDYFSEEELLEKECDHVVQLNFNTYKDALCLTTFHSIEEMNIKNGVVDMSRVYYNSDKIICYSYYDIGRGCYILLLDHNLLCTSDQLSAVPSLYLSSFCESAICGASASSILVCNSFYDDDNHYGFVMHLYHQKPESYSVLVPNANARIKGFEYDNKSQMYLFKQYDSKGYNTQILDFRGYYRNIEDGFHVINDGETLISEKNNFIYWRSQRTNLILDSISASGHIVTSSDGHYILVYDNKSFNVISNKKRKSVLSMKIDKIRGACFNNNNELAIIKEKNVYIYKLRESSNFKKAFKIKEYEGFLSESIAFRDSFFYYSDGHQLHIRNTETNEEFCVDYARNYEYLSFSNKIINDMILATTNYSIYLVRSDHSVLAYTFGSPITSAELINDHEVAVSLRQNNFLIIPVQAFCPLNESLSKENLIYKIKSIYGK